MHPTKNLKWAPGVLFIIAKCMKVSKIKTWKCYAKGNSQVKYLVRMFVLFETQYLKGKFTGKIFIWIICNKFFVLKSKQWSRIKLTKN